MKVLLTYANRRYRYNQALNRSSALQHCSFDEIWERGPKDLSDEFRRVNAALLQSRKGAGYWIWKPFIILQALQQLNARDLLFYCDAGAVFVDDATKMFELFHGTNQDIIISTSVHPEAHYTKRDAFVLMDCDRTEFVESSQRIASFLAIRNTPDARDFVAEWLHLCLDKRIVSDDANVMGKENYPGFKESKGDQSVISLLSKKMDLKTYRDPSQWGNGAMGKYPNSPYGQLIQQTWLVPNRRFLFRLKNKILTIAEDALGLPRT